MIGRKFGRLTVVSEFVRFQRGRNRRFCRCECECGTVVDVRQEHLGSRNTRSCGCLQQETRKASLTTHGMSDLAEFNIWMGMRDRCLNPRSPAYANYGGRGITICERWLHSFPAFLADIGSRPSPTHTLERVENSLGYSPENCRWATRAEQALNTRRNVILSFNGAVLNLKQWAERLGIKYDTLQMRVQRGWSTEQVLTQPLGVRRAKSL